MKLRLGAAVLAAALIPLTAATATSPAHAGVDTTPPEVGSCHNLTWNEVTQESEPDPAVACTATHTTVTTKIVEFASAPDWNDVDALNNKIEVPCLRARLAFFDGKAKALQLSAYTTYWFVPTAQQRAAGATWVRCDTGLMAGTDVPRLPTDRDPILGSVPLPDKVARCRQGSGSDYLLTTCNRAHRLRATHAVKYAGSYPGGRRIVRWTINRCSDKLGRSFGFYEAPTRKKWRAGLRYSVCFKKTRS